MRLLQNAWCRYTKHPFYKLLHQILRQLVPWVLIGGWAQALLTAVFSRNGFFAQLYHLPERVPGFMVIHSGLELVVTYSIGLLGLIAAILAARAVAYDHKTLAALTAGASWLIINSEPIRGRLTFSPDALNDRNLLFGLLFGLAIGWLFTRHWHHDTAGWWRTGGLLLVSAAIRVGLNAANSQVWGLAALPYTAVAIHVSAALAPWLLAVVNSLLSWLGLPVAIGDLASRGSSVLAAANLNAALADKTIPHLFTMDTLYQPFALFGGVGMPLALIVAVLLADHRIGKRRLAWGALGPSLVNIATPMLVGYPLLLEPIMLIPYVLAPLAACGIAWIALALHVMAPAVYSVPATTPGFLVAWLATNGNWPALVVSLIGFGAAVVIYWPFVKLVQGGRHA